MPFAVEWEAEAEQDLAGLPPVLASHVLDQVDWLAANPFCVSPSHNPQFPFPGRANCRTVHR
jgi:hypothetical protein